MSQEYQGDPGEEEVEITDDTVVDDDGSGTDTQPQPGGGTGTQAPAGGQRPAGRTFTQDQVNAFLANEKRKWDQSRGAGQAPARTTPPVARETPTDPFDDQTMAGLRRVIDSAVAPFKQAAVQQEITTSVSEFKAAHTDVDTKEKLDAVLDIVLELGPEVIEKGDLKKLLAYGYSVWKWGNFDLDTHTKTAIQDALSGKADRNRKAPNLQGGGGKAPVTQPSKKKSDPRDYSGADEAMRQLVREANANQ